MGPVATTLAREAVAESGGRVEGEEIIIENEEVFEKFKTGEFTGFSIGGEYGETEFIDED